MTISKELLDELLKGCKWPEDLLGNAGLMKELKVRLMERMLGAELTAHLGDEGGKDASPEQTYRSDEETGKTLTLDDARRILPLWRYDCNSVRTHSSLGNEPPQQAHL